MELPGSAGDVYSTASGWQMLTKRRSLINSNSLINLREGVGQATNTGGRGDQQTERTVVAYLPIQKVNLADFSDFMEIRKLKNPLWSQNIRISYQLLDDKARIK